MVCALRVAFHSGLVTVNHQLGDTNDNFPTLIIYLWPPTLLVTWRPVWQQGNTSTHRSIENGHLISPRSISRQKVTCLSPLKYKIFEFWRCRSNSPYPSSDYFNGRASLIEIFPCGGVASSNYFRKKSSFSPRAYGEVRRESKSPFLGTFTFLGVTSSAMEQYILQYIVGVFTIIIIYIVVPANNNIY